MDEFKTRQVETPESEPEKPAEVTGIVKEPVDVFENSNELEKWETVNGSYGIEYLGIKELSKEFPMKMHFRMIDKFIKGEIVEKGYDKTTKGWQDILQRLEIEAGSKELNAVERLKKLSGYIQVLNKLKKAKELKEKFLTLHNTS